MKAYKFFSIMLLLNAILYNVAKNDFFEKIGLYGMIVFSLGVLVSVIKNK